MDERRIERLKEDRKNKVLTAGVIVGVILLIGSIMWAYPQYRVYSQQLRGEASLREAEFDRQIAIREAEANLESQELNAEAEVARARGAAEAMEIEDGKLTDRYIRYLYVQNLDKLDTQLIYVPTEGGLPLLEAGRF